MDVGVPLVLVDDMLVEDVKKELVLVLDEEVEDDVLDVVDVDLLDVLVDVLVDKLVVDEVDVEEL